VAGIEAPRVADHADQPRLPLLGEHGLRIRQTVGERNFDLNMLACFHALDCLRGVHLRRRAQDDGIEAGLLQRLGQIGAGMADPIFGGDGLGRLQPAPDQAHHLGAFDIAQAVEMLFSEGAGTGECDLHRLPRK